MREIKLLISEDAYCLLRTSVALNRMVESAGPTHSFACAVVDSIERGDTVREIKTREERQKEST